MCDLTGLNKDFAVDERSGMTSAYGDMENIHIFPRYEMRQQPRQGVVRMEPKICTDIFSDDFLDIEKVESSTNGFGFNAKNSDKVKRKYLSDSEDDDDEDYISGIENVSGVVADSVDDGDAIQDGNDSDAGNKAVAVVKGKDKVRLEAQQQQKQQLDEQSDVSSVCSADSHMNDIRRIRQLEKPSKQRPAKKRVMHKDEWVVNKRKLKRNSGQEYINRNGNPVAAKEFNNKPCNCRMQCNTKFTASERKLLFDTFWDLQDFNLQNISLHGMIRAVDVAQHRDTSLIRPRFHTFHYYLQPNASTDEVRVCKRYFLGTFQLSHGRVYRCCSKPEVEKVVDHRGNPGDHKQQRRLQRTHVQEHIEQFALYKEKFLSSSLTIRNMYDLYVEECEAQNQLPLSQAYYHQMMDTILSVKLHKDDKQLQRRKKKALLKRLYTREELVKMLGTLLRQRRNKHLQKAG